MSLTFQSDIIYVNCLSDSSMRYDHREGVIVCIGCGLISQNRFIDQTAEYRIFSDENSSSTNPIRVGGTYNDHLITGGLGVQIEQKQSKKHVRTSFNLTSFGRQEKNYGLWVSKIKAWGSCLGLQAKSSIISGAIEKFERLSDKKIRVGGEKLAAMALLWACKKEKHIPLAKAFENATGFKENKIWKIEKKIKKKKVNEVKVEEPKCDSFEGESITFKEKHVISLNKQTSEETPKLFYTKSSVYAVSFGNSLQLPFQIVKKMEELAVKIENSGVLDGKNPKNIAGVAMLAVGHSVLKISQVAKVCEISAPTIKKTCKMLIPYLKDLGLGEEHESIRNFLFSI